MKILDILEVCLVLKETELTPEQKHKLISVNFRTTKVLEDEKCENCIKHRYVLKCTKIMCILLRSYVFGNCICNQYSKK